MSENDVKMNDNPDLARTRFSPVNLVELIDSNPTMRSVVVGGILRRGETANIIAAAKVGKSFMAGNLAWCVASGMDWLSHEVAQGRVLIIDNELHPETLANRLNRIAIEMMIDIETFGPSIDVISLRGENIDIHALEHRLEKIEPGLYKLAILDALYRTLPAGTSENDNAAMMAVYNKLDHYASQWDCAIAVVHHASKGQQGDKSVTDVGSGAGSISRAADTHIVIRPHETSELSVLECVTRSFLSPDPISIKFEWPVWQAVTVPPQVKKQTSQKQETNDKETDSKLMEVFASSDEPLSVNQLVKMTPFGRTRIDRAIDRLRGSLETRRETRQGTEVEVFWTEKKALDNTSDNTS